MRSEKYCLYKIYLFARLVTERHRQRRMGWRERDSNCYFSFKWPQATTNTEMNHTKDRSQELHLDLQHGCSDPRTYVITCCFPRHFSMGWFRSRAAWTRTGTQKMPEPLTGSRIIFLFVQFYKAHLKSFLHEEKKKNFSNFFLMEWQKGRNTQTESYNCCFTLQSTRVARLGHAEVRSPELPLALVQGWQAHKHLNHHVFPSQVY